MGSIKEITDSWLKKNLCKTKTKPNQPEPNRTEPNLTKSNLNKSNLTNRSLIESSDILRIPCEKTLVHSFNNYYI